ncbi:MAG: tRNA (adenosine(37)-N6)-dimethylallyltransferase MiaA [Clostridia bacterium]|nr:tRNA (adenosine(37)-N6)-dimethylallyltransferase MiaA [Clostridia bacterium]
MANIMAIAGPTASGKSALALGVCREVSGEIVSFDSMQIYKNMNIGTAKPTRAEQAEITHHLIDICEPTEKFSAADFAARASRAVDEIHSRGKVAVLCGGTGLYLDGFLFGRNYGEIASDEALRASLYDFAEKNGVSALHDMLTKLDPAAAAAIHENNVKRVVRAIEICKTSGMTKTEWDAQANHAPSREADIIVLDFRDREKLYARIDARVEKMIADGLADETEKLYKSGALAPENTAFQAIGYKEMLPFVRGEISLAEATAALKLATRHYAKRQLTWFRKYGGTRLYVDDCKTADDLLKAALDALGGDDEKRI